MNKLIFKVAENGGLAEAVLETGAGQILGLSAKEAVLLLQGLAGSFDGTRFEVEEPSNCSYELQINGQFISVELEFKQIDPNTIRQG